MAEQERRGKSAVLKAEGWERRTTVCEPRLSELVELYESLGFEVRLEPFEPEEGYECLDCYLMEPGRYKIIYTRPQDAGAG
ncbi:MAG: hypothetical protein HYY65_12850 [Candidatus Tectomicrobia bacterium]|uniref:Uncharacterized protein n=1 Tax=Tectimicrobiota bacterium TaxID=2528274 RepID=A0A932GR92_UNCTE|nr:hypothetical protein [Candidatus Tectomicrobia bacterium]